MKKYSFPIAGLIFLATFLVSCNKDEQSTPDPYARLCTPQSHYYFRGMIDDQSKCWNYYPLGENLKYQLYSGYGSTIINDTAVAYYWMHGLAKTVNNGSPESIIISSKTTYDPATCTRDQFFNSFQTGVYPIRPSTGSNDYPDFEVYYETPDSIFYTSEIGKQYDGQLELVSIVKKPDAKNVCDSAILCYRLKCTVFRPVQPDSLRISIGELTVIQLRLCNPRTDLKKPM
jgi:hypothetical protein